MHLGLQSLDGLGRQPQTNHAIALRPKYTLPLQVNLLDLVVADVREGNRHAIVCTLAQEHALTAARLLPGLYSPRSGARHLRTAKLGSSVSKVRWAEPEELQAHYYEQAQ